MEQEELDKKLLDTQPEHLPEVPSEIPVAAPRPGRSTYISLYKVKPVKVRQQNKSFLQNI
jgi:hypothetical protein